MNWHRVRRFLQFKGNLGALRYEAQFGIFELNVPNPFAVGNEIDTAAQKKLLAADERSTVSELGAWESEGGATQSKT